MIPASAVGLPPMHMFALYYHLCKGVGVRPHVLIDLSLPSLCRSVCEVVVWFLES